MRHSLCGVGLVLLAAPPALAGAILYATAASQQRVDGFRLAGDGSFNPRTPTVAMPTASPEPRRLLVGEKKSVLYVAEVDRVEAFGILCRGGLEKEPPSRRSTRVLSGPDMDPRDLALSEDQRTLYVTQRGYDRIVAYPLDDEGYFKKPMQQDDFTSCVQGEPGVGYLNLQRKKNLLNQELLYVSADGIPGRIEVFRICPDGSLAACPDPDPASSCSVDALVCPGTSLPTSACRRSDRETEPLSLRTRLQKPKDFVISGEFLYVEERALKRITAFRLQPDGTFCDKRTMKNEQGEVVVVKEDCPGFDPLGSKGCAARQAKKRRQQCPASTTASVLHYESLVVHPNSPTKRCPSGSETLLGVQFFRGRIDAYRLGPERPERLAGAPCVRLPKHPTSMSATDVRMTPVRAAIGPGPRTSSTLYIAAGELDRVVAYRLNPRGLFAAATPFDRTAEEKDSFPNDVAVVELPPCR